MTDHLCQWPDCTSKATLFTPGEHNLTMAYCEPHAKKVNRVRSHTLAIAQLKDWLTEPRIVKALLSTGTATKMGLRTIFDRLEDMDEAGLWATTAVFAKDRRTRRVIATHQAKTLGISKSDALKGLLELSEIGRGA